MNRQLFYQYLDHPQLLDEDSLKNLNELMSACPYFQPGRMLLVKNLAIKGHITYNMELKKAAAHIPDRRQLYFLVNPPLPNIPPKAEQDDGPAEPTRTQDVVAGNDDALIGPNNNSPIDQTVDEPQESPIVLEETKAEQLTANYFEVSDVIDLDNGTSIDFSLTPHVTVMPEPELLPTADLLDYETASAPYQLGTLPDEPFDPNKTLPFSAWLKAMRHPVPSLPSQLQGKAPIDKQMQIIESFLQKGRDRIVPDKNAPMAENKDISEQSVLESDALMTETLANIHIKQKQYQKAIAIFEKLGLKYPEKSIYFAARIKDLESLITNP